MGVDVLENEESGFCDGTNRIEGFPRILGIVQGILMEQPHACGAPPPVEAQLTVLAESLQAAFHSVFLVGEESDERETCGHEFLEFL